MSASIEILIYEALDEAMESLPKKFNYEKKLSTNLFGGDGMLDSLGLVSFLICLEQKIEDHYNIEITIANEKAMSLKNSPFRSVKSLQNYLDTLVDEKNNET